MNYFLNSIAKSLYSGYGDRLKNHCLVFPGRRAGLFFLKYLAAELDKPVWTPAIMTINDLFRSLSNLQPAENEILLFELYKVYRTLSDTQENFDEFYFWGDMLLNDFDDIDKYLADSSKLFRNVYDLKKIDQQFGGLTPEQAEIIKQFWTNFNPGKLTNEKSRFISIWSLLNELYNNFKINLKAKNLAYEGMIYRDVIENHNWKAAAVDKYDMVHFIGFNALNACEKSLMQGLKNEEKARFYWDYDNSYISAGKLNSAGFFLKDNLRMFGNDMPDDWNYDTLLSQKSDYIKRQVIDTSSDVAQVKLIPELISRITDLKPANAHHTAVVLADENLLMPVLTSLPENVKDVNITMGYPLRQTSVYLLIKHLLEMQSNARVKDNVILFSHSDVIRIMKNSLISGLLDESDNEIIKEITEKNLMWIPSSRFSQNEKLSVIFRKTSTPSQMSEYLKAILSFIVSGDEKETPGTVDGALPVSIRNEFIYRVILSINRLDTVSDSPGITFTIRTWARILDRLLNIQSVPFSGEPLTGIQIMGILETRTLDFRNLIILSVNEGILPAATSAASFIPFSLREAFGLPSINHQESIYAYHFYRLLHRAENVTFVYNSNPDGLRSGEKSRFLQQMKYEPIQEPEFTNLSFEISNPVFCATTIERTNLHYHKILSRFSGDNERNRLSPSAINTWLNCRMRFYYRYVNDLKEPEKISEEIDPAMLGILLHESMRNLYSGSIDKVVDTDKVNEILNDKEKLNKLIVQVIKEKFQRNDDTVIAVNELIVRNVLLKYISRVLEIDRIVAPFTILALEKPVGFRLSSIKDFGENGITIGGTVDRVDFKDGITRIVDYKTGTTSDFIASLDILYKDDREKEADGWLQTMIYCEGYLDWNQNARVRPSVYKIKKNPGEEVLDKLLIKTSRKEGIPIDDYGSVRKEFMEGLEAVVKTLLSKDEPFIMTVDKRNKCSYCPYRILCMR